MDWDEKDDGEFIATGALIRSAQDTDATLMNLANRHRKRIREIKENAMAERLSDRVLQANKFYVGSHQAIDRNWGHATLEDAIEHASGLAESQESDQFIVQIVKVVRRPKAPVVVEDLK